MLFVPFTLQTNLGANHQFVPVNSNTPLTISNNTGVYASVITSQSTKEMKVDWPVLHDVHSKQETAQYYHIFVGDLSPEIETQNLKDAFISFGEISDCRVVRDPQTLKSRGYGFVSFSKKSEAENAIFAMNGQWLGSRNIRTNWATRKPTTVKGDAGSTKPLTFDNVYNQSSPTNCTVYCGGIANSLSDEIVQKIFAPFGNIQEVRVFKDKGYAFIRFSTKESATHAIVAIHNTDINGKLVKCSWGKESSDTSSCHSSAQVPFPYGHQVNYWYTPSYPATAGVTAATQLQGHYMHSVQNYPYNQFGYHQGYAGRVGLQLPNATPSATWYPQIQLPAAVTGQGALMQQQSTAVTATTVLPTFPSSIQQFQLSRTQSRMLKKLTPTPDSGQLQKLNFDSNSGQL